MIKTAGIIIIGNEILSGKVRDTNSSYLASELRGLGVSLMRIAVIPDDIEIIGEEALEFSKNYDYVFTSGGVGPTHDDVTIEGIAKGFQVKVIKHPELVKRFRSHYRESINEAVLKMAEVPEGAELVDPGEKGFPFISFRNIFILPGIPQYLIRKFSAIKERFRTSSFYLKRLFINANETDIAAILDMVVHGHREVTFGSYPIVGNPEYKVIVTAESRSPDSLNKAFAQLLKRLPGDIVVRVD